MKRGDKFAKLFDVTVVAPSTVSRNLGDQEMDYVEIRKQEIDAINTHAMLAQMAPKRGSVQVKSVLDMYDRSEVTPLSLGIDIANVNIKEFDASIRRANGHRNTHNNNIDAILTAGITDSIRDTNSFSGRKNETIERGIRENPYTQDINQQSMSLKQSSASLRQVITNRGKQQRVRILARGESLPESVTTSSELANDSAVRRGIKQGDSDTFVI
jgi:hypothetical protein